MTMPASLIASHDTGRLFEPDTILPTQFYACSRTANTESPNEGSWWRFSRTLFRAC